jgi:hypothetical protein
MARTHRGVEEYGLLALSFVHWEKKLPGSDFAMRMFITIGLCALLLTGCAKSPGHAPSNSSGSDSRTPLGCVKCSYVEEKGSRRISGGIQNDSQSDVRSVALNIDFRDSKGNTVGRQEKTPLPVGDTVAPGLSEQFTVSAAIQQNVTHAILYFENSKTGEKLSAPTTLLLIVSLE